MVLQEFSELVSLLISFSCTRSKVELSLKWWSIFIQSTLLRPNSGPYWGIIVCNHNSQHRTLQVVPTTLIICLRSPSACLFPVPNRKHLIGPSNLERFPSQDNHQESKLMVRWSWVTPHWRCQKYRLFKVGVQVGVHAVSCAYERVECWDWFTLSPPSVCRLIANRLGSQPIIIINPGPCHTIIHWNAMKMEKVTRASLLTHIFFPQATSYPFQMVGLPRLRTERCLEWQSLVLILRVTLAGYIITVFQYLISLCVNCSILISLLIHYA